MPRQYAERTDRSPQHPRLFGDYAAGEPRPYFVRDLDLIEVTVRIRAYFDSMLIDQKECEDVSLSGTSFFA